MLSAIDKESYGIFEAYLSLLVRQTSKNISEMMDLGKSDHYYCETWDTTRFIFNENVPYYATFIDISLLKSCS